MTDRYVLSIDPGKSTGIALGVFSETEPYRLRNVAQWEGGLIRLRDEFNRTRGRLDESLATLFGLSGVRVQDRWTTICEKFTPLQNQGFNLTLDAVEPLRCEGWLVGEGWMPDYPDPTWRRPASMYKYGGKSLPEKKKRAYAFLKDSGMHITGTTVGQPDAFDARSATLHGISYVIDVLEHKPTFDLVASWNERND